MAKAAKSKKSRIEVIGKANPKKQDYGFVDKLKKNFKSILSLNLVAVIIIYASWSSLPEYSFHDPALAQDLLKYFDEFEPIHESYYNFLPSIRNLSTAPYMGLYVDDNYCDKHRAIFVKEPNFIFRETNALFDHWPKHTFRQKTVAGILTDFQPNVSSKVANKTERYHWIDPRQNYFPMNYYLHANYLLGKNFGCLTQAYGHIPGDGHLNRKDFVSEAMTSYAKQYMNRPQCFSYEKRFPRTWVMYIKEQCLDFFKNLQSEKHAELQAANGIVYIRKIGAGAHNAKGVFPMDDEEIQNTTALYDGGKKCGVVKANNIIQYFVPKPLLLFNRKFHFRIYMFIASMTPLVAYYHDGYVKLSLNEYDPHSNDKLSLISNVLLNKTNNETNLHGMTEKELQYFSRFDLTVFQKHLLDQGIVTDPNFVKNHLKLEFKKTMVHLLRMTGDKLLKRSQVYELFGIDFIMDDNLDLWFIECNSSPSLEPTYPETAVFLKKLVKDQFEIVMGFTRSRTKRVIKFINDLTKQGGIQFDADRKPIGLEGKKEEFKKIIQNSFEPEFVPSRDNGFELIIDEHIEGPARYMGLLSEECL